VVVADAQVGEVCAGCGGFVARVAFGLELAEFGGAAVEKAVALGSGAINGVLELGGGFVLHCVGNGIFGVVDVSACYNHGGFDFATAVETPHGSADLIDVVVFELTFRDEVVVESFIERFVAGFFAGTDEIFGGEEAGFEGVFRGGGLTGFRAGPGGVLRVGLVGCDFCC
jgi:hypothetical protein